MVRTRSMNERSTRNKTYSIIDPVAISILKKHKHVKKKEVKLEEPVSTRKPTRVLKPKKATFDIALYGRDRNGRRNRYHGWVGDPWQRDFNGWESPSSDEREEESTEDKQIARELKKYKIGHAGYALDGFIVNEVDEEEEVDYW